MKKLLYLSLMAALFTFLACGDDDDVPQPMTDAPSITASTAELVMNTGETETSALTLSIEGGLSQFVTTVSEEGIVSVTLDAEPMEGATSANLTATIEAIAPGSTDISFSVQDAEGATDDVTISVTVIKGFGEEFASAYEFLTLRPEFKDHLYLVDRSGTKELLNNEVFMNEENQIFFAETMFLFKDGWLDDWISNSPFINSRDDLSEDAVVGLESLYRFQQRDNDVQDPFYRNNLDWASIIGDGTNAITGNTMNVRNQGIIGNSALQAFARPFAFNPNPETPQLGLFDTNGENPTYTTNALAVDVRASVLDYQGETVPHIFIHAFDQFPIDFDAVFADPQGHQDQFQGRARNWRDVSILERLYLMDPDVKWTMNTIDPEDGTYAGSAGMYGVVIVPASVFDDLNAIIEPIDAGYTFGNKRVRENAGDGDTRSVWFWDGGAAHIPDAVYSATANYWLSQWIPTEDIENGALADGTYSNAAGADVSISGNTVSIGNLSANIVTRARYQDERINYDIIPEGNKPSQAYQDATTANGYKYVEVIIVDGPLQ